MARPYLVKEIFGPTLQGEGAHAGRSFVFLRFAGCDLDCDFCDTDHDADGATQMSAAEIVAALERRDVGRARRVVVTGGEPTLQWDAPLAAALAGAGFRVHLESNGGREPAAPVAWLTVSPKLTQGGRLAVSRADECKVVVDERVDEALLSGLEGRGLGELFLQPCWGPGYAASLQRAVALALARPAWRVGLQLHRIVGVE
jgi:organic radical activating enzyme